MRRYGLKLVGIHMHIGSGVDYGHLSSVCDAMVDVVASLDPVSYTHLKAAAGDVFQKASSVIDRVADKNIIHKNKAARHKSRLAAAIKALA